MDEDESDRVRSFKGFFLRKAEFVGLLACILFCAIFWTIFHISPKNYIKDVQSIHCQSPNYTDGAGFLEYNVYPDSVMSTFNPYNYRILEYVLYKHSGLYGPDYPTDHQARISPMGRVDDFDEFLNASIPVVVFPGMSDTADTHHLLGKMLRDRPEPPKQEINLVSENKTPFSKKMDFASAMKVGTKAAPKEKRKKLHFNFLAVDFSQITSFASYEGLRRHIDFLFDIGSYLQLRFPEPAVYMCHGYGSILCYWVGNLYRKNVTMVILESSPAELPGFYTAQIEKWLLKCMGTYHPSFENGIISFEAGFDDTNVDPSWLTRRHGTIPVWTIDGVPDNGLSARGMLECKPYLEVVSDLLTAEKMNRQRKRPKTGASVVKSFIERWQRKKEGRLPKNWKKDMQDGLINVRIGEVHNFLINGSRWLDIDVQRNTSLVLQITGPCLTAATIVRRRILIKRKEALFNTTLLNSTLLEFGIYQVKPFESVRVFLESNTTCQVTIETSPWWLEFTQRFYQAAVVDTHYFYVGAQIAFIYLAILESDKRPYRREHQLYLYFAFIIAVLYHTFYKFGMLTPGLIYGAGFSITVHFICCTVHNYVIIRHARRSLDSIFRKFHNLWRPLVGLILFGYFSSALSSIITILMYTWLLRPMLLPAAVLAHIPVFYRILYQPMTWGKNDNLATLADEFLHTRRVYVGYAMIGALVCVWSKHIFPRHHFHCIAYVLFACQLTVSEWPLDFHYGIGILILALNHARVQNVPRQIYGLIDLEMLDRAYDRQDEDDDEE